jgi:GTPase
MNRRLRDLAVHALDNADLVLYVIDSTRAPGPEEESIAARVAKFAAKTLVAVNKVDLPESDITRSRLFIADRVPGARVFDISAEKGTGVEALKNALAAEAPLGLPTIRPSSTPTRNRSSASRRPYGRRSSCTPATRFPMRSMWST